MPNKQERKALKIAMKKEIEEKKVVKSEQRKDIAEWKAQHGGLTLGHHCPHKEQAKTHAINEKRCTEKQHIGYCPACFNLVSFLYGCSVHRCKKDELLTKRPSNFERLREENAQKGLLGPGGLDARVLSQGDAAEQQEQEGEEEEDSFVGWEGVEWIEGRPTMADVAPIKAAKKAKGSKKK